MVLPRIAHRNPVSYYRMLWTAARYSPPPPRPPATSTARFSPGRSSFPTPVSLALAANPCRRLPPSFPPTGVLSFPRDAYPWKAPPCRRAQCEWPRPLCHRLYASIDTYLPIRAGAMLPIPMDKCVRRRRRASHDLRCVPAARARPLSRRSDSFFRTAARISTWVRAEATIYARRV